MFFFTKIIPKVVEHLRNIPFFIVKDIANIQYFRLLQKQFGKIEVFYLEELR